VPKVQLVLKELKVQQDLKELKEQRELKEHKVLLQQLLLQITRIITL